MTTQEIHIVGAGPAGLAAALYLARAGWHPIVFEQAENVGTRFCGHFQGLENWSTDEDATCVLASLGIDVNFRCAPYDTGTFYGPSGRAYDMQTTRPLFYLIERGSGPGSLDQGLKQQALEAGVEIRFGEKVEQGAADKVIVATGPRSPDAIARGMVFETAHPDACFGFLGAHIAPRGYAYLLVHKGKATLATCLFDDFQQATQYFERALETILNTVDLDVRQARTFGGYVTFGITPPWSRGNRLYFVGERAGFQDALWGFGLRYALQSGVLAAMAIVHEKDYDALCREHLVPRLETALANRLIFSQLGNHGYEWVLRHLDGQSVIEKLRQHHRPSQAKHLLYEIASRRIHPHLREQTCDDDECACLWCTHGKQMDTAIMDRCVERYLEHAS